jgi:hypothetical protein
MTFEKFKEIVDIMVLHNKNMHNIYKLKIDLTEVCDEQDRVITLLWNELLTKEGVDWFDWFIYEKGYISGKLNKDLKAFDENKNEIIKDIKGLYNYLIHQKYFK